jgi:hypothetical protein
VQRATFFFAGARLQSSNDPSSKYPDGQASFPGCADARRIA